MFISNIETAGNVDTEKIRWNYVPNKQAILYEQQINLRNESGEYKI